MQKIPANLKRLFARSKMIVLPEDYFLIHLPPDAKLIPTEWYRPATTRFAVLIREPRGVTLFISRRKWLRMRNIFSDYESFGPMKVISLDMDLSLEVYGFIAALSAVFAKAQISIVPVSTFKRDHIAVKKAELPRAVRVLRKFLERCRK